MDSAGRVLRLVLEGRRNGVPLIPYTYRGVRQPWQLALRDRILAEVGSEDEDVIRPERHSR